MSSFTEAGFTPTDHVSDEGAPMVSVDGLRFDIGAKDSGLTVIVPDGFLTDGPSLPRAFLWLRPRLPLTRMMKSAAVHDVLRKNLGVSKWFGDAVFREALEVEGNAPWFCWLCWLAVSFNFSRKGAT